MKIVASIAALTLCLAPLAGQTPQERLWDAAIAGDTGTIRSAVTAGAKLDSLDQRVSQNGRYALNWAALYNHPDAVTLLLDLGANINAANITGFTALHHAAENGSSNAMRVLLKRRADHKLTNRGGATALDVAMERDNQEVILMLENAAKGILPD